MGSFDFHVCQEEMTLLLQVPKYAALRPFLKDELLPTYYNMTEAELEVIVLRKHVPLMLEFLREHKERPYLPMKIQVPKEALLKGRDAVLKCVHVIGISDTDIPLVLKEMVYAHPELEYLDLSSNSALRGDGSVLDLLCAAARFVQINVSGTHLLINDLVKTAHLANVVHKFIYAKGTYAAQIPSIVRHILTDRDDAPDWYIDRIVEQVKDAHNKVWHV